VLRGRDRLLGTPKTFDVHECARCGAGLTLPYVPAADLGRFYSGSYQPYEAVAGRIQRAISSVVQWLQGWRALRRAPLAALRRAAPGRAVDVGCGRGDLGALLIRHGWQVTGVEPSEGAAATARSRGIDARTGTLADAGLESEGYDAAVFQHSLEHVPEPVEDLALVHAALRPGGLLLMATLGGGGDDLASAAARLRATLWGGDAVEPSAVVELLSAAGYVDVTVLDRMRSGLQPVHARRASAGVRARAR
jgi:SAM-dependent methyltransferase